MLYLHLLSIPIGRFDQRIKNLGIMTFHWVEVPDDFSLTEVFSVMLYYFQENVYWTILKIKPEYPYALT